MDFKNLTFTSAMPEYQWIEEIIFDVVKELPAELFDEIIPWTFAITQNPFIHYFDVKKGFEASCQIGAQKRIPKDPIFPIDSRISEINLRQFLNKKPLRVMILGDTQPLFNELSKLLATEFDTNLITPEYLLNQEIDQRTEIGIALENIHKSRKGIPAWVILNLLEKELEKEKYLVTGFILTGFPFISNMSTKHKPKNSENMQFFNKKYTFPEGSEKEVIPYCAQMQMDYIRRLFSTQEHIIYLDTNKYTQKYVEAMDVLQKFVIIYPREHVIRVDCRIGLDAIFNSIRNGFKYIKYKINYKCVVINESQKKTLTLDELCDSETILPNYKWWISKFGKICPVNLFHGRLRFCDSKFPVRFLKYIIMCYSREDREQFIQNPSKHMVVIPKCRIAVIGPHKSGKTTLSRVIAKFFQAEVYNEHIQQSEDKHKNYNPTKELNILQKKHEEENESFRKSKILEWNECVMKELNDIFSNAFQRKQEVSPEIDWFTSKNAANCFRKFNLIKSHMSITRELLQKEMVFLESLNLGPKDFLSWLQSKPESNKYRYKQYVIDSPSIELSFWKELLDKDELPDCVLFLSISSIKKLFDIYSSKHDEICVSEKNIFERIISKISYLDDVDIWGKNIPVEHSKARISHKYNPVNTKSFIKGRYETAMKFMEKYEKLQEFLRSNNVSCIDIDISKHGWSKSIEKAILNYITLYQIKAKTEGYEYDIAYEEEIENGSGSSPSLLNMEEQNEEIFSMNSSSIDFHYGSCLDWCPVSLVNERILKKGNSLFSATYRNKVYTMNTSAALHTFVSKPGFYAQDTFPVPPPRVYVIGSVTKSKISFAESVASSLNVECFCYKHSPFSMSFKDYVAGRLSLESLEQLYAKKDDNFFDKLSIYYNKGVVLAGYPFLVKQFKNMIANNFYPEYILLSYNEEESYQAYCRLFARYQMLGLLAGKLQVDVRRASLSHVPKASIVPYIESLQDDKRDYIARKSRHLTKLLQKEILKIEEECLKLGIPIVRLPELYKRPKQISELVETINNHRVREALFEKVEQITMAESNVLLTAGYYRFSRFKYSCPVDVTRLITLNSFTGMKAQNRVYPCIYQDFIYFLCGEKNLKDFKRNPLEYVNTCNPPQQQDPIRIAVFGASKSGISTICHTVAHEFGFKILRPGPTDSNERVIDLLKMERHSTPNGIILDNFALTPALLVEAAKHTVDITVVFILVTSFEKVLENWFMQNRNKKTNPKLSLLKIYKNFCETSKAINKLRMSAEASMLNLHYIDGDTNSWTAWDRVKNIILKTTGCITSCKLKFIRHRVANLEYLNMFYDTKIFHRDVNLFYCQSCLSYGKLKAFKYFFHNVGPEFYSNECQNMLNKPYGYLNYKIYDMFHFAQPFEDNELREPLLTQSRYIMCRFEYIDRFYWSCSDHTINFMLNTQHYHNETPRIKPLYVPFLVIGYNKEFLAFQGYCPVEYERGRLVKGSMYLAAYYRRKVYLMKCVENTHEFLMFPEKYHNLRFDPCKFSKKDQFFQGLNDNMLTQIILDISKSRPIHFALDGRLSATTLIALKLSLLNSSPQYTYYWNALINSFTKDCKQYQDDMREFRSFFLRDDDDDY